MTSLLEISGLRLALPVDGQHRELLHGVSLSIGAGESVAIVGESGSGKSMTARSVLRLLPDGALIQGKLLFGKDDVLRMSAAQLAALRSDRVGMIFQDPRAHINPVRRLGDFLTEALTTNRKMATAEAERKVLGLLRDVAVSRPEERLRQYPHELSGGLLQRMMIAAVLAMEPDLILADEPTTALDVTTQSEVMGILEERRRADGLALLLITHDLELAAAVCDRTAVMYAGAILEQGESASLHEAPLHPYTAALAASRPRISGNGHRLSTIPGRPLSAVEGFSGCPFAPRCPHAISECGEIELRLAEYATGTSACIRTRELAPRLRVGDAP